MPVLKLSLRLAATAAALLALCAPAAIAASSSTAGAWSFVSAPNLHPPKIRATTHTAASQLAPGYFLLANFKNTTSSGALVGQGGPLVLDSHLQPVWFHPLADTSLSATDLEVQRYAGKPVLSWWQGTISKTGATTSGQDIVVDQHYRQVASLTGANGWILSPHEFTLSGTNAWVTAYKVIPMDLSLYGGSASGFLLDSAIQEYSLKSHKLLYQWDAKDHIPLSASETHPAPVANIPWDAYHVNSIQLLGTHFLTSMRNTWAAYYVDESSNNIVWSLGGKNSTYALGAGASFEWQHDVIAHPGNVISVFDDACCAIGPTGFGPPSGPSRALVLALDNANHTATVKATYSHGATFDAGFLGSTQLLPGGNVLVGWGSKPYFSEYSKSGKLLLDAVLPGADITYRTLLGTWQGMPLTHPSAAARRSHGKVTVYASWDGATKVASWRVLGGSSRHTLVSVARRHRTGFETAIAVAKSYKAFRVQALDSHGHVLSSSGVFAISKGSSGSSTPSVCFYPPC